MSHLGERASALVDGQLSAEATERAMAHLAGCRPCRDAVEVERLTKSRLAFLSGPEPTGDLMSRLLAMGGPSGPLPPRPGHVPGSPRPHPVQVSGPVPIAARTGAGAIAVRVLARPGAVRPATARPITARLVVASFTGARPGVIRPTGRPLGARPAGRPTVLGQRRARLAGAVLCALGVVGAGVGGLVIASPGVSGGFGAGADGLTVQQQATSTSTGPGRRSASSARPVSAPTAGFAAAVPEPASISALSVDLTGLPPVAYHSAR